MLLLSIAANCVYLMCNLRSFIFCIAAAIHNYWKFLLKDRCSFFQRQYFGKWQGQQYFYVSSRTKSLVIVPWYHWHSQPGSWSRHPVGYLFILSQLPAFIEIALGAASSWLYIIFSSTLPSCPFLSPWYTYLHTATHTWLLTEESHNLSENVNFKLAWNLLECKG